MDEQTSTVASFVQLAAANAGPGVPDEFPAAESKEPPKRMTVGERAKRHAADIRAIESLRSRLRQSRNESVAICKQALAEGTYPRWRDSKENADLKSARKELRSEKRQLYQKLPEPVKMLLRIRWQALAVLDAKIRELEREFQQLDSRFRQNRIDHGKQMQTNYDTYFNSNAHKNLQSARKELRSAKLQLSQKLKKLQQLRTQCESSQDIKELEEIIQQ